MENILIPYDFSELSDFSLELGMEMAEKLNAKITVLNIIHTGKSTLFNHDGSLSDANDFDVNAIDQKATLHKQKLKEKTDQYSHITFKVVMGDIEKQILDHAASLNTDLIIMGTHGASGIQELISGSITDKIIRLTDAAVISLKCKRTLNDFKSIVLAADFDHPYKENVTALIDLKRALGAELHFVRINTPASPSDESQIKNNMQKYADENNIEVSGFHTFESPTIEKGIEDFMDEKGIEIVAIASKGRLGLNAFFKGCISADLVNHLMKPVFTFRAVK